MTVKQDGPDSQDSDGATTLRIAAHELRAPLTGIIAVTELLNKNTLDPQSRDHIETIREATRQSLAVMDRLIGGAAIAPDSEPADLATLVAVQTSLGRARALGKGLRFHDTVALEPLAITPEDASALTEILSNLLDNAVKYTNSGSIEVIANTRARSADRVELELVVEDTGPGIPNLKESGVLDPYVRGTTCGDTPGVGLGLSLVAARVRALAGTLEISRGKKGGSCFKVAVTLGLKSRGAAEPTTETAVIDAPDAKLLVVEDNYPNRILISAILDQFGFGADQVDSGEAAIQAASEANYDVVLMDIEMPGIGGLEAARRLRAARTPAALVAMSAHPGGLPHDADGSLFDDIIEKPISAHRVYEVITAIMGARCASIPAAVR